MTANLNSKSRYNPHVFTEQGLYILLNVIELIAVILGGLKGEDEDGK